MRSKSQVHMDYMIRCGKRDLMTNLWRPYDPPDVRSMMFAVFVRPHQTSIKTASTQQSFIKVAGFGHYTAITLHHVYRKIYYLCKTHIPHHTTCLSKETTMYIIFRNNSCAGCVLSTVYWYIVNRCIADRRPTVWPMETMSKMMGQTKVASRSK